MNPQVQVLREKKRLYLKELQKAAKTTREVLRETDPETDSNLFSDISLSRRRIHTLCKLVDKADEAITGADNYGICKSCGEPISPSRLKAVPFTEYCAICKRDVEEDDTFSVNGVRQRISHNITI